jgi:hypothetical protein
MREEEISWLSCDAEDVSTLPDMAALWMSTGVCCCCCKYRRKMHVGASCYGGV